MLDRLRSAAAFALLAAATLAGCSSYGPGLGHFDTVVVDAGHGGHDSGGRARAGRNEKDLALDTARRLAENLKDRGFRVIMTRSGDYFVTLGQRVAVSNSRSGCIFVSVHYNWDRGRSGHGVETYFSMPRAYILAANVNRELARAYPTRNRGVKQRGFYVLRKNRRPAILVEGGFVSNPSENAVLQTAAGRQRIADAIARGIVAARKGKRP